MKTIKFIFLSLICSMSIPVLAQTPMDPVIAKFNEGAAKVNAGDFKVAIADFEEVLVMTEKFGAEATDLRTKSMAQLPVLHYIVATGLMKQKKFDEAIPELKKTVELADLYNNNADSKAKALKYLPALLAGVGSNKVKEQDFPGAMQNFDDALKYDPNYAKAFLGKGLVYADQMKEKDMLANLNKAIELSKLAGDDKTIENANARLGSYYVNMGNINLADVDPDDPDYSAATASFEKAISYNPAAADAYYLLAVILNKGNNYDSALVKCNKALSLETDPTKVAAINYELGNAYFGNAEYPLACEAFNKAMVGPIAEKAEAKKEKVPGCQ